MTNQVSFISRVLKPDFKANGPSKKGYKCEVCEELEVFASKKELIRHFLLYDKGHWRAAFEVGQEAFGSNQDYKKRFETLMKKKEVTRYLKNKEAAHER